MSELTISPPPPFSHQTSTFSFLNRPSRASPLVPRERKGEAANEIVDDTSAALPPPAPPAPPALPPSPRVPLPPPCPLTSHPTWQHPTLHASKPAHLNPNDDGPTNGAARPVSPPSPPPSLPPPPSPTSTHRLPLLLAPHPPPQPTREQREREQRPQDTGQVVCVMGSFSRSVTLGGAWLDVRRNGVPVDPTNLHVDMMRIKEGPAQRQMDAACDCPRPDGGCCCAWRLAAVGGRAVCTGSQVSAIGEQVLVLQHGVEAELAFVKEHAVHHGNFGYAA